MAKTAPDMLIHVKTSLVIVGSEMLLHVELTGEADIKLLLAIVVEGDQKAPFSIATTPRWRGGRYSFPWIAPLYP